MRGRNNLYRGLHTFFFAKITIEIQCIQYIWLTNIILRNQVDEGKLNKFIINDIDLWYLQLYLKVYK